MSGFDLNDFKLDEQIADDPNGEVKAEPTESEEVVAEPKDHAKGKFVRFPLSMVGCLTPRDRILMLLVHCQTMASEQPAVGDWYTLDGRRKKMFGLTDRNQRKRAIDTLEKSNFIEVWSRPGKSPRLRLRGGPV